MATRGPRRGMIWNVKTRKLVVLVDDNDAGRLLVRAVLQLAGLRADSDVAARELLERLSPRTITRIKAPAADATTS
jgi:hypothetical protein